MKKLIYIFFVLPFLMIACKNDMTTTPVQTVADIEIRIENTSQYDFKDVFVNTGGGEFNYGDLNGGETSEYHTFDSAYSYSFIELMIDGSTYTMQPIDFVGETPLESGKYTYQLDASDSMEQYDRLTLTFVED